MKFYRFGSGRNGALEPCLMNSWQTFGWQTDSTGNVFRISDSQQNNNTYIYRQYIRNFKIGIQYTCRMSMTILVYSSVFSAIRYAIHDLVFSLYLKVTSVISPLNLESSFYFFFSIQFQFNAFISLSLPILFTLCAHRIPDINKVSEIETNFKFISE